MCVHYNNVRSFSFFYLVSTANTTTTVQPLGRSNHNNNVRQPAIVQRRHHSQPASVNNSTAYRATQGDTTATMISAIESNR